MNQLKQFLTKNQPDLACTYKTKAWFLLTGAGVVTAINKKFTELLGYTRNDIVGKSIGFLKSSFIYEDDQTKKKVIDFQISYLMRYTNTSIVIRMQHKKGFGLPVKIQCVSSCKSDNASREIAVVLEQPVDTLPDSVETETVSLNEIRWIYEEISQNILQYSGDSIILSDLNGRVINVNPAALRMLGYDEEDNLNGKYLYELGPTKGVLTATTGETISITKKYIEKQVKFAHELYEKGITHCDMYLYHKDGRAVPVEATLSLLHGKNNEILGTLSILRDATNRLIAENKMFGLQNELEIKVKDRTHDLEEANSALKVFLQTRNDEQKELEEKLTINVERFIQPYLSKLRTSCDHDKRLKRILDILETNWKEITSPFGYHITAKYSSLTPTELQVADLIRQGKSTKLISKTLDLAITTIATHRRNIRKKLGVVNKKTNLQTLLKTLQK